MIHNKGKKYINCPECKRRRYCNFTPLPDDYRRITCSKGHERVVKLPTLERVTNMLRNQILPSVRSLFDRDDIFYKTLRKR